MKSKQEVIHDWKKGREEIELLETLAGTERSKVATDLGINYEALTSRIETIRRHAIMYPWYASEIKRLSKHFPYIAGLLAPQKPDTIDLEVMEL